MLTSFKSPIALDKFLVAFPNLFTLGKPLAILLIPDNALANIVGTVTGAAEDPDKAVAPNKAPSSNAISANIPIVCALFNTKLFANAPTPPLEL